MGVPKIASEAEYIRISALTSARIAIAVLDGMLPLSGANGEDLRTAMQAVARIRDRLHRE